MSAPSPPLPRFGLAATCLGHAVVLGWAASVLPWRSGTTFALSLGVLALAHLATAACALLQRPTWRLWSLRALSLSSALVFLILGWSMAASAIYVAKLYLRLGPTVAGLIALALGVLAVLTLPIAIWAALRSWPEGWRHPRKVGGGAALLAGLMVLTLPLSGSAARGEPVPRADSGLSTELSQELEQFAEQPAEGEPRSVAGADTATCRSPVTTSKLTLIVAYVQRSGASRADCLQNASGRGLRRQLHRLLERRARPGSTVVLDLVKTVKPLSSSSPLLDALEVRPGLDGVCDDKRCLTAWQLTLSDVFSANRPLSSQPDMSYGFSSASARKLLGTDAPAEQGIEGLLRIETESLTVDRQGVHRLTRTRATPPALSAPGVERAVAAAQRYIIQAQEEDGTFRYSLDPATGAEDKATLNLPRQAGTAYALCELGHGAEVRQTVRRALGVFESTERRFGQLSALEDAGQFGLGKSALPLLAMLRCRSLVGASNDRLIGRLARLMLALQRPDGSFYPALDPKTRRGTGDHQILYAAGQAVLSLVLLEQQRSELVGSAAEPLPSPDDIRRALDSAMSYYGGPYWPRPLRDFFFFEEGWHCLAARQALSSHPNQAYEQLCLDYVASRMRFLLRPSDTSEPNFVGGSGLSDLFPPRNTATAGAGEALNAAIAIKQRRGLDVSEDKQRLRDLLGFLLRAQWSESGCYACAKPEQVVGGFSQQLAAPDIRIDYVQHAMAALGHGGKLLF